MGDGLVVQFASVIDTVLSGPAGGVAGARPAAELNGLGDPLPFEMGGTSTDISLIADGRPTLSSDRRTVNQRIALPSLDIVTLGAGDGRIDAKFRAPRCNPRQTGQALACISLPQAPIL